MNKKYRDFLVFFFAVFSVLSSFLCQESYAYISLNIKNQEVSKISILFENLEYINEEGEVPAISDFRGLEGSEKSVSAELSGQSLKSLNVNNINFEEQQRKKNEADYFVKRMFQGIRSDLNSTNLFEVLDKQKLTKPIDDNKISDVPDFEKYYEANVNSLLVGSYGYNEKGKLEIKLILWDILDERQLFAKYYVVPIKHYRKVGHYIANEIYKNLTGEEEGYFNSKIIYIAESGDPKNRKKRVAVVDFDGLERKYLTDGKDMALTPVFSRKNKDEIVFMQYKDSDHSGQIYKMDLKDGFKTKIGRFSGMTYSPNFHPDGENKLLFSATNQDVSNIYLANFDNAKIRKLTYARSIDTTPSFSPDGERIVFESDRSGSQKLYTMASNGKRIKKISFGKGGYAKPAWSPDGRLIAFTKIRKGRFFIGVMRPNGENERILTEAYMVEGVKWSPNGRCLIYSKQKGPYGKDSIPKLYVIDIMTGYEYQIPTPPNEGATDPDWVNY